MPVRAASRRGCVGNRVGEVQLLFGGQAEEAVIAILILGECALGAHQGLLLGLELHAGAQHVEVDADAGVVGERGLAHTSSSAVTSDWALAICAWSARAARYWVPIASTTPPRTLSRFMATTSPAFFAAW